jgi:hypothetical protein
MNSKKLELLNLREVCHTDVHREDRPGVGHSVRFVDELYDTDGNLVATSKGTAVVYSNPADGSLMQQVSATDQLPDGDILWTGNYPMDDPEGTHFLDHRVQAVGISGAYLGLLGSRTFQYLERPDEYTTIIAASITLGD